MSIIIKAPHMEVTDALREHIEAKASKLPKYYRSIQSIEVILAMEADKAVVEIVVGASHKHTFVATQRDDDMYACIDQCTHKITEQLRRHKDKVRNHHGPSRAEITEMDSQ